ncbi:MAG: nucleotidyltransferase domain-containing protein [Treponema sp.]|jgi:predicted nucleotidyltransferase|nr:nucleotidyltransferase domain-containing protein [Treponema sp.]
MEVIEMSKPYTIDEIRQLAVPIAQRYGVEKMALFGSYARNEQNAESDIDFLIDKGAIRGIEFFGFVNDLEDGFGVHVDVMTYDSLKNSLIADVLNDELVLYE